MDVLQELEKVGAVTTDKHFIYASGKHGLGYINMDHIFPFVGLTATLCQKLIAPFQDEFDTVASPATGGIVLSVLSAQAAKSQGVWADKDGHGGFVFERAGFAKEIKDKKVLIVEDLLTTGGSVAKVCREVEKEGGEIVGVSVVCNRGGVTAEDLGVARLESLATVNFTAEDPEACQLCAKKIPIIDNVGHGYDYKKTHPDYEGGFETLKT